MAWVLFLLFVFTSQVFAQDLPINHLQLPPGFKIEIYAYPVPNARSLALGDNDTVFVGTFDDKVYAIVKSKNDQTRIITLAKQLNLPNGVAFYNHDLYVAEINRILRFNQIENNLDKPNIPVIIFSKLPNKRLHGWRYIAFGPDKKLYIAIGMPCNVCLAKNSLYGTIYRMNADGSQFELIAQGIRNSVGFDWHPITKHLWFTDNGRDWMGDEQPIDEMNEVTQLGLHFGFPYFNGFLPDPFYEKFTRSKQFIFPKFGLSAHVAALGMKFYTGKLFPKEYQHQIFIAEHGSWNRTQKVGYEIVVTDLKNNTVKSFISGWLINGKVWGRPVDLLQLKDGSLLISDDYAGAIYRVTYNK